MYKTFILSLAALACAFTPLYAKGSREATPAIKKEAFPVIVNALIMPASPAKEARAEIQLSVEWPPETRERARLYALFRAERPLIAQSLTTQPDMYPVFVGFLTPPASGSAAITRITDNATESGWEYFYRIFATDGEFPGTADGKPAQLNAAALPSSVRTAPGRAYQTGYAIPKDAPPGIYTGIMLFSDKTHDLTRRTSRGNVQGALVPLDTHYAVTTLVDQFKNAYHLSDSAGTSLYFAVHKALVTISNSMKEEGVLPKDIRSIHIVIITDGYDNNSADPALERELPLVLDPRFRVSEPLRERGAEGYAEFFQKQALATPDINGVPLTISIFGISGADLTDVELEKLKSVLNANDTTSDLDDARSLQNRLSAISENLDTLYVRTHLFASMPALSQGDKVVLNITNTHKLAGTVRYIGGKNYLTNIETTPPSFTVKTNGGMALYNEREKGYEFILDGNYYEGVSGVSQTGRILVNNSAKLTGGESFINLNPDYFSVERKTALVYFVVDNSWSLGKENIALIRASVSRTIERLYEMNVGRESAAALAVPASRIPAPAAAASRAEPAAAPAPSAAVSRAEPASAAAPRAEPATPAPSAAASRAEPAAPAPSAAAPRAELAAPAPSVAPLAANPAIPKRSAWTNDFVALVRKYKAEEFPWRVQTTENTPSEAAAFGWFIQIGAYRDADAAQAVSATLGANGFIGVHVYTPREDSALRKVHIGPYDDEHIMAALNAVRVIWESVRK